MHKPSAKKQATYQPESNSRCEAVAERLANACIPAAP
jgi:hypothetical protein